MRRLAAGTSGGSDSAGATEPSALGPEPWPAVVQCLARGRPLRAVQRAALLEARVQTSRQNLVVSAPTNSGKSLIGQVVLLDAVLHGRRAVLLEPLRALAQEQADELGDLLPGLVPTVLPSAPKVRLTTGDYRLEGELLSADPPRQGEVIVATPERLDAILRTPEGAGWASSVGAVVIDEAHLLADPRRGPTLELLAATMLSMKAPPRLALLSATVGEPERLREWLRPCQLVTSLARTPLVKEVWEVGADEDADAFLSRELGEALREPTSAALVFVYRRQGAEALARKLETVLGLPVAAYHAGLSMAERRRRKAAFREGGSRCLVATTALAMGVNLPATHVFVRDTMFFGTGRLRVEELLQILGRAGRGDRCGFGAVLVRARDDWKADELALALQSEAIPPLRSSFDGVAVGRRRDAPEADAADLAARGLVATCLARAGDEGHSVPELQAILGNTLGGRSLADRVEAALRWLETPTTAIGYCDEQQRHRLTVLGLAGVRCMLPLPHVAGFGRLLRDLVSVDPASGLLRRWSCLDHLLVACLLSDRTPKLRRFSEGLASQLDAWHEGRPHGEKSLLFAQWLSGTAEASKADELLGSLGLAPAGRGVPPIGAARQRAYVGMLSAVALDDRSRGVPLADIESRWRVAGLEGVEEALRDTMLWLVAGQASLCEVRAYYHHLRETCGATLEQVRVVKAALTGIREQAYDLLERLKYCSPLGPMLRGIRQSGGGSGIAHPGEATIRALEAAGLTGLSQVSARTETDLVAIGVQRRFARQIRAYLRRRQC